MHMHRRTLHIGRTIVVTRTNRIIVRRTRIVSGANSGHRSIGSIRAITHTLVMVAVVPGAIAHTLVMVAVVARTVTHALVVVAVVARTVAHTLVMVAIVAGAIAHTLVVVAVVARTVAHILMITVVARTIIHRAGIAGTRCRICRTS